MFLLIETTTDNFIIALGDGRTVSDFIRITSRDRAASLLPELDNLFRKTGLSIEHVRAVGAGCGPGSFTGIRVGASCAITIAQVCGIPLYGISSMDIAGRFNPRPMLAAFRDHYYTAEYNTEGNRISDYELIKVEKDYKLPGREYIVNHNEILEILAGKYYSGEKGLWQEFEPVYVMKNPFVSLKERDIEIGETDE